MSKKGRQVFQEKNRGVTPSVAAPGVTHPSDATAVYGASYVIFHYTFRHAITRNATTIRRLNSHAH